MKNRRTPEIVVVTGASAGVGRATVRAYARRGAHIGLIARGRDGLELMDLAAARVENELGPIDVWINNAMVSVFSPVREMTAQEYRRVTEVTYLGYVHGTLAALRHMLPRCSRPTARPSTRSRAFATRCAASCSTMAATCNSAWSSCRP